MRLMSQRRLSAFAATLATAVLATCGVAGAQANDPIQQRKELMKEMGKQTDIGADMVKGKMPFDSAAAATVFKTYADVMAQYGALFPEGSDTGDTKALPEVWLDREGFDAAIAKFKAVLAQNAAKVATKADFEPAFVAVAGECRTCHQSFKAR